MVRFLENFVCLMFCFIVLEFNLYSKDYNEIKDICRYIEIDLLKGGNVILEEEKYKLNVYIDNNKIINYEVTLTRESLFNIKQLKTIKYHGIVR